MMVYIVGYISEDDTYTVGFLASQTKIRAFWDALSHAYLGVQIGDLQVHFQPFFIQNYVLMF